MKKTILSLLTLCTSVAVFAQSPKMMRNNASVDLQDYQLDKIANLASLDKAKQNIDKSLEDANMQSEVKSWLYKGQIYQELCNSQFYVQKYPNQGLTANAAFLKVIELDANKKNKKDIRNGMLASNTANGSLLCMYNDGIGASNQAATLDGMGKKDEAAKLRGVAFDNFNGVVSSYYKLNAYDPSIDSTMIQRDYSLSIPVAEYNAAYNAARIGKLDDAIAILSKMKGGNPAQDGRIADVYNAIVNKYLELGQRDKAKSTIADARKLYPKNQRLLISSIVIAQDEGKLADAEAELKEAVENDPNNDNLKLVLGKVYNDMFDAALDAKNQSLKDEDMASVEKQRPVIIDYFEKAKVLYTGASIANPKNIDAVINLAVIHFNFGVDVSRELNLMSDADYKKYNKDYEARKKQYFEMAQSYFEKAEQAEPSNVDVLTYLKKYYQILGNDEKTKEYSDKLTKIGH